MAGGQKLSLRAYSFSLRKWRSKLPDKVYHLNSELHFPYITEFETGEYVYSCAMDLFKDFINENTTIGDKTDTQQLFYCKFDPINQGETETYSYLIFSVFSGYYGFSSDLIDRESKIITYKKSRNEADVKQFYVMIAIPKDTELQQARRGLIFFQEIGIYGIKTITVKAMQTFFSQKLNISFREQNLAPDFYLKKLFESGVIQNIRIARNSQSGDNADRLYGAGYGREERTLVPLKVTKALKDTLRYVSESKYNFFTFDKQEYPEVRMVVKIGDRTRTINLHGLDDLSIEEALPQELLSPDGTIYLNEFKAHILTVAEEYLNHLPHDFNR